MLSPMYIFSAHNIRLALSALHGDLDALHCSPNEPHAALAAARRPMGLTRG